MADKLPDLNVIAGEMIRRLNDDTRRIRILEQRSERYETSIADLEGTFRAQIQETKKALDDMTSIVKTLAESLNALSAEVQRLKKELDKKASKVEMKEVQNYVNLLSPVITQLTSVSDEGSRSKSHKSEAYSQI